MIEWNVYRMYRGLDGHWYLRGPMDILIWRSKGRHK